VKTTSHSWFARQGSPEVFITHRTHGHGGLFRRKGLLVWPVSGALLRSFGYLGNRASRAFGHRPSAIVSRDNIVMVVLGGELAVPCTRNPLQRG